MKRMRTFNPRTAAGLIEALIAVTLTLLVFAGVVESTNRGMGAFRVGTANNEIDSRAGRTMSRITREVMGASSGNLEPNLSTPAGLPRVWSSSLDFRVGEAWDAGGLVWSEKRRLVRQLAVGELDNDLDDNGDGLADEGSLVFFQEIDTPDEQSVVLANGLRELLEGELANGLDDNGNGLIDESGLSFDLEGDVLNVRFSLERLAPDGSPIVRTQVASLRLRNSGT